MALRQVTEAFSGVPTLAARGHVNAMTLYRTLSPKGNPKRKGPTALLNAMGMRVAVRPIGEDRR